MTDARHAVAELPPPGLRLAATPRTRRQILVAFSGVMLTTILAALDQTVVATALPSIVGDLHGFEQISWVVSAYLIASAVAIPLAGRLSDLYGRRLLYVVSISLFLVGSVLCGIAQSMDQLIASRIVQGLGAGGMLPLGNTVLGDLFAPRERGRYQGLLAGAWALAGVAGPIVGGALTDHASWRWIFLLNIPLCALALAVILRTLPPSPVREHRRLDVVGVALMVPGVAAILLAASWGGVTFPWGSPHVLGATVAGVALLVAFVLWERRVAEPLVPFGLFTDRTFAIACTAMFLMSAVVLAVTIYVPLLLQAVSGDSATDSGTALIPFLIAWTASASIIGQVVARTGRYKAFPVVGAMLVILAFVLLSRVDGETSRTTIGALVALAGAGLGMTGTIYIVAVQNTVGRGSMGLATGGVVFFRTIGGALSVAALGTLLITRLNAGLTDRLGPGASAIDTQSLLHGGPNGPQLDHATVLALTSALQDVFLALVPIAVAALVCALALQEHPLRDER